MTRYVRVKNGTVVEIIDAGQPLDQLYHPELAETMVKAGKMVEVGWSYDGEQFNAPAAPSFDSLKELKINELTLACSDNILGGYTSDALGNQHIYPSKLTDQINMMGSVTDSLLQTIGETWATPFWCADGNGLWAFRPHSSVEIQKAGADGKAHIISCQEKLSSLSSIVYGAESEGEIQAISW